MNSSRNAGAARFEKIVVVTKRTALEELLERHSTREQARFYVQQTGADFAPYQAAHETYQGALSAVRRGLPESVRWQVIDRGLLPTFLFDDRDLVVTLGPDGLVVNTAKYLHGQPLIAINPDPARFDGILVPFGIETGIAAVRQAIRQGVPTQPVTMARATLNDGQSILALNDLFIGQRSHVSARYQIAHQGRSEQQSSSGIIVSTGAGSTGWLRSVVTGAVAVVENYFTAPGLPDVRDQYRFGWQERRLAFAVREPFISRVSSADLAFGWITDETPLVLTSQMPQNGVIFSDGIENDYLEFNSGSVATIGIAEQVLNLAT